MQLLVLVGFLVIASAQEPAHSDGPDEKGWILIDDHRIRIPFKLYDQVLELKTFPQPWYITDKVYTNGSRFEKEASRVVNIYKAGFKLGTFNFGLVKFYNKLDVAFEGCGKYLEYAAVPCPLKAEQIWGWDFTTEKLQGTCDGTKLVEKVYKDVSGSKCTSTWGVGDVDAIELRHMKGEYYRGVPRTIDESGPEPVVLVNVSEPEWRNCGDCWKPQHGHCSKPESSVKQTISQSGVKVVVKSVLRRKKYNKIVLFDTQGVQLGFFRWSLRGFFLAGCSQCGADTPIMHNKHEPTQWSFSLINGVVAVDVGEVRVYELALSGSCATHYSNLGAFSFQQMECDEFLYDGETMEMGSVFQTYQDTGTCID